MKKLAAVMSVVLALCIGLAACGSGGGSNSGEKFVDTWTVSSLDTGTDKIGSDQMERLLEAGYTADMAVFDDGSYYLRLLDDTYTGEWRVVGDNAAEFKLDGSVATATVGGDTLILTQDDSTITFTRGEYKASSSSSSNSSSNGGSSSSNSGSGSAPSSSQSVDVNKSVIDDANLSMTIISKGIDSQGDPIVYFSVTNKSDRHILLGSQYGSIDGAECDPVFATELQAGESLDRDFFFFEAEDVDVTSVDDFKNISVDVYAMDADSYETLQTYTIEIK